MVVGRHEESHKCIKLECASSTSILRSLVLSIGLGGALSIKDRPHPTQYVLN